MATHILFTRNLYRAPVIRQEEETSVSLEVLGWRYVKSSNSPVWNRMIWLLITVTAFVLCIYQIEERFSYYMDDPSKIEVYYVRNYTLEFPTIAICPYSEYHSFPSVNSYFAFENFGNTFNYLYSNERISVVDLWNVSRLGFYKLECFVSDVKENFNMPSNSIEISEVLTTSGICIKFSPKRNLFSLGGDTSVKIVADNLIVDGAITIAQYMAEDASLRNYYSHRESVIDLKDNKFEFNVRLEEVIYRNTKAQPCTQGSTSKKCLVQCLDTFILADVSQICRLPYMQVIPNIPPCSTMKQFKEVKEATLRIMRKFSTAKCNCPRKCRNVLYDIEYSDRYVYSPNGRRKVVWFINISQNVFKVTKEKKLYSGVDLFSDFGGTLSLYLGLCLLNILEIFTGSLLHFVRLLLKIKRSTNFKKIPGKTRAIVVRKNLMKEDNPFFEIAGFKNVLKSNNSPIVRCLWLVMSLLALICLIYQCTERISYFLSEPLSTNVYYVYNRTIKLPSMMICPVSVDGFLPAVQPFNVVQRMGRMISYNGLMNLLHNGAINIDELWNMSRILGKSGSIIIPFTYDVTTLPGICKYFLPINADTNNANTGVIFQGLDTGFTAYYEAMQSPNFRIIFLDHDELPIMQYLALHAGFTVDANTMLDTLRIGEVLNLNARKNPCTDGETVSKCLYECIHKSITSKLEKPCRLPFMHHTAAISDCLTVQDIKTLLNITIDEVQHFKREACNCPRKCSDAFFNLDRIQHIMMPNVEEITFIVRVSSNKILVIQEVTAYSVIALLSDIGGCLSLFLGLCGLQILKLTAHVLSEFITIQARFRQPVTLKLRNRIIVIKGSQGLHTPSVDIPGFSQIFKSSTWWGRTVWTLLSIMALAATSYQCAERINYFLSDASVINVHLVFNESILIPSVVQCYMGDTDLLTNSKFAIKRQAFFRHYENRTIFIDLLNEQKISILDLWDLTRLEIQTKEIWMSYVNE